MMAPCDASLPWWVVIPLGIIVWSAAVAVLALLLAGICELLS